MQSCDCELLERGLHMAKVLVRYQKGIDELRQRDKRLADLIRAVGPFTMRPELKTTPFESLASSIVYQQLSGKAAATILGRMVALFPGVRFPTPKLMLEMDDQKL